MCIYIIEYSLIIIKVKIEEFQLILEIDKCLNVKY